MTTFHKDTKLEDLDEKTREFMISPEGINALWNKIGRLAEYDSFQINWLARLSVDIDELKKEPEELPLPTRDELKRMIRARKHHQNKLALFRGIRQAWCNQRGSDRRKATPIQRREFYRRSMHPTPDLGN